MDVRLAQIVKWVTGSEEMAAGVPDVPIKQVIVAPTDQRLPSLWVALSDQPDPADIVDAMVEHGTAAIVAEKPLPCSRAIVWVNAAAGETCGHVEPGQPVGLIVPDARQALLKIAAGWRSSVAAKVIVIIGSEALRTTQRLVESVLSQRFRTVAPDVLMCEPVQSALGLLALRSDSEWLVLRMSLIYEDNLRFVREVVRPDTVMLINLHPTQADRSAHSAERDLLQSLSTENTAIVNVDDPLVVDAARDTAASMLSFGIASPADVRGSGIESHGKEGIRLRLTYQGETIHLRMPLLGRSSAQLTLSAAAAGFSCGESWEEIVAGLRALSEQLQLLLTPGLQGATFIEDSYDATPSSVLSVLHLLEEIPGRKIALVGDMNEFAPLLDEGHRKVGRRVMDVAEHLVTVGQMGAIVGQEAVACGMPSNRVHTASDSGDAVDKLREVVQPGDIVLVTGAGRLNMREIVDRLADAKTSLCEV